MARHETICSRLRREHACAFLLSYVTHHGRPVCLDRVDVTRVDFGSLLVLAGGPTEHESPAASGRSGRTLHERALLDADDHGQTGRSQRLDRGAGRHAPRGNASNAPTVRGGVRFFGRRRLSQVVQGAGS